MVPKNPPVLSHKTNTNPRKCPVLIISCQCDFFFSQNWKVLSQGSIFQSVEDIRKETVQLLKALSQNGLRRCFEAWKARMERCIASDGNYFERG